MRCKIDPKYDCGNILQRTKAKWDYINVIGSCANCEIFLKKQQTQIGMENMTKKEKLNWIEAKLKIARTKQKEAFDTTKLLRLEIGETEIHFHEDEPRDVETKYGDRVVFSVYADGILGENGKLKVMDYMVNPNTSLYLELLEALYAYKRDFIIVRSGTGKQTRYSIKSAK